MSDFKSAISTVIAHEGGSRYTNIKGDKGGPTKWGLSLYRFWLGKDPEDFPQLGVVLSFKPPTTAEEVKVLTLEQAEETYQKCWWGRFGYWRVDEQLCATKILDMAVNMRRSVAHQLAQRAARDCGRDILVDGIFGWRTVDAINSTESQRYLAALCQRHLEFYQTLVAQDPARNEQFRDGWFSRAAWPLHVAPAAPPAGDGDGEEQGRADRA